MVEWVDLAGASPRGSTALKKTVICRYFSQTPESSSIQKLITAMMDLVYVRAVQGLEEPEGHMLDF